MAVSIVQTTHNLSGYQVGPLSNVFSAGTTAGSYVAVVIEAQKTGYPYASGSIDTNTTAPIITDNAGTVYTLVDKLTTISQDSSTIQPDASGFFPSAYIYISSAAVTAGMTTVSAAAFYPDEVTSPLQPHAGSPPVVNGRAVFDGGIHMQTFELAGMSTGAGTHGHGSSNANPFGASLATSAGAALILEVGILIDSSAIGVGTSATSQHSSVMVGGSSHFLVQTTIVGGATANKGFVNPLLYTGGAVVVNLS